MVFSIIDQLINLLIIKNGLSKKILNYFKKENKNGNKDKEEENN